MTVSESTSPLLEGLLASSVADQATPRPCRPRRCPSSRTSCPRPSADSRGWRVPGLSGPSGRSGRRVASPRPQLRSRSPRTLCTAPWGEPPLSADLGRAARHPPRLRPPRQVLRTPDPWRRSSSWSWMIRTTARCLWSRPRQSTTRKATATAVRPRTLPAPPRRYRWWTRTTPQIGGWNGRRPDLTWMSWRGQSRWSKRRRRSWERSGTWWPPRGTCWGPRPGSSTRTAAESSRFAGKSTWSGTSCKARCWPEDILSPRAEGIFMVNLGSLKRPYLMGITGFVLLVDWT